MAAAGEFIAALDKHVPAGPNKAEAFDRAQKAIMVATGAFATRRG